MLRSYISTFSDVLLGDQLKELKVSFNDIVGLQEAKEALEDAFIYPLRHPEIYSSSQKGKIFISIPFFWVEEFLKILFQVSRQEVCCSVDLPEQEKQCLPEHWLVPLELLSSISMPAAWLASGEETLKNLWDMSSSWLLVMPRQLYFWMRLKHCSVTGAWTVSMKPPRGTMVLFIFFLFH